jgi:uncharacterized protein YbjT (DUF2867 family)
MRILVLGGTGVLGRQVVSQLLDRGHAVAVLSRRGGAGDPRAEGFAGDLATGDGVEKAIHDAECVIDCATVATFRTKTAVEYFDRSTKLIGRLGAAAGVRNHVVLSIVGIDRFEFGYYQGKLAQERAALDGPVPATVLRATQFHEFAGQNLDRLRLGRFAFVPTMRSQPIAAAEVAAALADIAEKPAAGRLPDIGGPRIEWMPDLARATARHRGQRVTVVPLRIPGKAGRGLREGGILLDATGVVRGPAFADWLAKQP